MAHHEHTPSPLPAADATSNLLTFFVNGRKVQHRNPDPDQTLIGFLRENLALTGTKLGCSEGGCGACTVMLSHYDLEQQACDACIAATGLITSTQKIVHLSANACLVPIAAVDGVAVTTVEGIGSIATRVHPVQERIAMAHGSQCGFCTPGIVMSMYTLLRNNPEPTAAEIEDAFEGNLCRCTGYRAILDGFQTFSKSAAPGACPCGKENGCCKSNAAPAASIKHELFQPSAFVPLDPSQEPIFPPELLLHKEPAFLQFGNDRVTWYRPATLDQVLHLKARHPHIRLAVGNTELTIEHRLKHMNYAKFMYVGRIPDLLAVSDIETGVRVGSSVTLTNFGRIMKQHIATLPEHKTRFFRAAVGCLKYFAGAQVRNIGCVGGNVVTACTISDLIPVLQAANSTLHLASVHGQREVSIRDFYLSYRKTALHPEEILISIDIPFSTEQDHVETYKQSKRKEDDLAIIAACFHVKIDTATKFVTDSCFSFGGVTAIPVTSPTSQALIKDKLWDRKLLVELQASLAVEHVVPITVPGGMPEYRRVLLASLPLKFFLSVSYALDQSLVDDRELGILEPAERLVSCSHQVYEAPLVNRGDGIDPVGLPKQHLTALEQATGEATYVDDIPPYSNELHAAFVYSTKAHAKIISIDANAALALPGVVDFVTAKDVPGSNLYGPIVHDEECFASSEVLCDGFPIGLVVATSSDIARRAAPLVKVVYEDLPAIISIQQAIAAQSYFSEKSIKNGDFALGFSEADHVLEGELHMGGQEHFYLETQACICVPKGEHGEMDVISSTQSLSHTQHAVAIALGVASNRVNCHVKRLGGGFGGKESRSMQVAVATAIAARKLKRPVRCVLTRQEDMLSTGGRHPFYAKYRVGFSSSGRVRALQIDLYSNAGCSLDLSGAVMDRALFHSDNCYNIPHVSVTGRVCRTNLPSNTAFRGFGGPQGMFFAESWIGDVARVCQISQNRVRELNFYQEGDLTHYNQALTHCQISRVWEEAKLLSKYEERAKQVNAFNASSLYRKRGLALIPTKFGIAFTAKFLNQAGALVHVYTDGSVLVAHGGVEMGQGLHVKMTQIAARSLEIPMSKIHISETATNTVANASSSAASASADLNGMAVLNACEQISARLAPYKAAKPEGSFEDWVSAAYFDRINLSANGFYATPNLGYDFATNSGRAFNYYTHGAACSEVELDALTGESRVLRTDLVMDLGASLNPAIDIGQIEGAFVQGQGLFCMEEMLYSPKGKVLSVGPGSYKIPGFRDIPLEFNVSLLHNAPNVHAVHSSKAVGEPPLFLGSSVYFALKEAVIAARVESGISPAVPVRLDAPATAPRLRMAVADPAALHV